MQNLIWVITDWLKLQSFFRLKLSQVEKKPKKIVWQIASDIGDESLKIPVDFIILAVVLLLNLSPVVYPFKVPYTIGVLKRNKCNIPNGSVEKAQTPCPTQRNRVPNKDITLLIRRPRHRRDSSSHRWRSEACKISTLIDGLSDKVMGPITYGRHTRLITLVTAKTVISVGVQDAVTPAKTISGPRARLIARERETQPKAEPNSPQRKVEINCSSTRGKSQERHRTELDDTTLASDTPL
jgi:hypothetical protein